jgi:lipoprotein-anchoring transpeptidase ErfK/SrfK
VSVTPEQAGFGFEVSLVQAMLVHHVGKLDTAPLALVSEQIQPSVTTAMLEPARAQAAAFVAEPIVLTAADKTIRVQAKELGTWISVDTETFALVANEEAVEKTITRFAGEVDGDPMPKIVVTGTDYVIDPGKDGHGIDRAAALTALAALVTAPEPARAVTLVTSTLAAPLREVGSLGAPSTDQGKEIVVVLSEQRLYAWNDGHLDKTYLISSGSTFPTHLGTFAVYNKIVSHTMAGADYNLPGVPHSMYYDGLRALHGAYWHNNFGNPMSHGCINEPLPEAEWLYNWTPMGTTVRVVQ